ncbi:VCBS domain-containing protein [Rhizobium sp. SL86]|uniref:VCBS domain-containing protein n=1 Tax=Rhizobium sp. SL86 TaxID=2995148 RepID=UPI002273D8EE|nr:VCBS domain-containing protein [Rhizobium sp. SL86]MCY1668978.1 VCBS domain-containing protein [Rhizobium sp. SL86]
MTGTNDAPVVSGAVLGSATEDGAVVSVNALANASDVDAGTVLSVVAPSELPSGVSFDVASQSFRLDPSVSAYQSLAAGQTTEVTVRYGVSDGTATTPAEVRFTVTGTNDAPVVSDAVLGSAAEDGAVVSVNALANASDVDAGTVLSVVAPSELPSGVSFDVGTQSFRLDPSVSAYQSLAAGQTIEVTVRYGVSDGTATTPAEVRFTVTGTNDAPVVSGAVLGSATEDGAVVSVNALANASDVDAGTVLSVVAPSELPSGVSFDVASQSFRLDPSVSAYQSLAAGQTTEVTVRYGVSDGTATTPAEVRFTVTGTNDAPVVSDAVLGSAAEDGATVSMNALANASDVDAGTVLSVVAPSELPSGVSFDVGTQSFRLDPSVSAYQSLAAGQTTEVTVRYGVSDGTATTPAEVRFTVTGTNDAPVVSDAVLGSATEDGAVVSVNALANASDVDAGTVLSVVAPSELPAGVSFDVASQSFRLDPSVSAYQSLAAGQTTEVTVRYGVSDGTATTPAEVRFTVTGTNDAPVVSGAVLGSATEDGAVVSVNALANASDVDAGTVLSVVAPSELPSGVSFDVASQSFRLDPSVSAYQSLAAGQTIEVTVRYGVSDGTATTPAEVRFTVTGTNDAPVVSGAVLGSATEDGAVVSVNALANASDVDAGTVLSVVAPSELPSGVSFDVGTQSFRLDPSVSAYQSLAAGQTIEVTVRYGVSDGTATTPAEVRFTVTGTNDAPVVSGAVLGSATEDGAVVSVNALANASDVDAGTVLSVVAPSELPSGVSFDVGTQSFRLDPTVSAYQSLAAGQTTEVTVRYGVSDGTATSPAEVRFTVTGTNDAPVVSDAVLGSATEDGAVVSVNALANASDVDAGTVLSVVAPSELPAGVSFDVASQSFRLDPSVSAYQSLAAGQTTEVTVRYGVSDGTATTPAEVRFTVTGTNDAPVVSGAVLGSATEDGAVVSVNALANASDVDAGTVLSVVAPSELPSGVSFDVGTQSFRLDPTMSAYQSLAAGQTTEVTVRYGVSDGTATTPAEVRFTVTGTNDAPVVSGAVLGSATEDGAVVSVNALANASDVDAGTVLSVVAPSELPSGVSFDVGTQSFRLDPTVSAYQSLAAGQTTEVTVRYGVSDGTATTPAEVRFTVTGTNDAPVVSGAVLGSATEDGAVVSVNALANASDVDAGTVLSVVAPSELPSGVSFDVGTQSFRLDPTVSAYQSLAAGQTTEVTVRYGVSDGTATSPAEVRFTVTGTNDAPVVTADHVSQTAEEGSAFSYVVPEDAFTDVDAGDVLSFEASGLAAWLSFDTATRTFSGTPANGDVGSFKVTLTARDGAGAAVQTITFTVGNVNDAPVVTGAVLGSAAEDGATVSVNALANASDVDAGTVLSVVAPSELPAGVSFDVASQSFRLDPSVSAYQSLAAGQTTEVTVRYGVSDGTATTPAEVRFTVTGTNDAPVVTADHVSQTAEEGSAFSYVVPEDAFTDVDAGDVLSFEASGLAAWLSFDTATRTFSGTPANGDVGSFKVTLTARDGAGAAVQTITFTVGNVNDAPVVTGAVLGSAAEDGATVSVNALANASDVDAGTVLSVVAPSELPSGVSFDVGTQSFRLDPTVSAYQSLAAGQTTELTVRYGISDGTATTPAEVRFTVTGTNDAPVVSGAVLGSATEDGAVVSVNALANASDVDAGTVLSVVAPSELPAGVSFDVASQSFRLDPSVSAYQSLAAGQTTELTVRYGVSDGTATTPAEIRFTITGTDDVPIVVADKGTMTEDTVSQIFDVLVNDTLDKDAGASNALSISGVSVVGPTYYGIDANDVRVSFNQDNKLLVELLGSDWQKLPKGASMVLKVSYSIEGDHGSVGGTLDVTVTGINDAPVLDASADLSVTITEDAGAPHGAVGFLVSDIIDPATSGGALDNVSDADLFAASGIALSGINSDHGTWYWSLDNGTTWIKITSASESKALLLSSDYRLYFQPAANYSGTGDAALTFHAWDRSFGTPGDTVDLTVAGATGGSTAFSVASDTVTVTVEAVNDTPVLTLPQPGSIAEAANASAQDIAAVTGNLTVSDADIGDLLTASAGTQTLSWSGGPLTSAQVAALTAALADGTLTFGDPVTANGATQTIGWTWDPMAANLDFLAKGQTLTVSYDITVGDGHGASATKTLAFTITGTDDKPLALADSGTMTEDAAATSFDVLATDTLDKDAGALNTVTIGNVAVYSNSYGLTASDLSVTVTADNRIQVALTGAGWQKMWNGEQIPVTITYRLNGDNGDYSTNQLQLTVLGRNDAPVLNADMDLSIVLDEGSTLPRVGGGILVSSLVSRVGTGGPENVTDDSFVTGIAIVGADTSHGTWYISTYDDTNGGWTAWKALGTVSDSHAMILRGQDRLVFVPAAGFSGTVDAGLTLRAWDGNGATYGSYWNTTTNGWTTGYSAATDTVSVTVNHVNHDPVINEATSTLSAATDEDKAVTGSIVAEDVDGDTLTYALATGSAPAHGTVTFTGSRYTYTPVDNYNGADSFTVVVSDAHGGTDTVLVNVTVAPVNDVPVLGGDVAGSVKEDTTLSASGTLTIVDPDAGESSFVPQTNASGHYGTFTVDASGHWTYTLDNDKSDVQALGEGHTLSDTFTVTSADGTASKTVTITIDGTNDVPAIDEATSSLILLTDEDRAVTGTIVAGDVDGDALTYALANGGAPTHGTVTFTGSRYTYTPVDNYNGADSFTVVVSDAHGGTDTVLVNVTVAPVNDVPVLGGDVAGSVTEDTTLSASGTLTIVDPDAGESGFVPQTNALGQYGTFTVDASGHWTYTLDNDKSDVQALGLGDTLTDTFTVTSADGTNSQTVTVTIDGTNDMPVTVADMAYMSEDSPATAFRVLENDTLDRDATALNTVSVTEIAIEDNPYGLTADDVQVSILADNRLNVTLGSKWQLLPQSVSKQITITYSLEGDPGASSSSTLTINVGGSNDAPLLDQSVDLAIAVEEGTELPGTGGGISLSALVDFVGGSGLNNVSDDGTILGAAIVGTNTANGQWYVSSNNGETWQAVETVSDSHALIIASFTRIAFVPNPGFTGTMADGLVIRAIDDLMYAGDYRDLTALIGVKASINTDQVQLTVISTNHAPVAIGQSVTIDEDHALTGTVGAIDADAGDTVTFTAVAGSAVGGTLTAFDSATGAFTFVPNANFHGSASFQFVANDGRATSQPATISIDVEPVNDAPVLALTQPNAIAEAANAAAQNISAVKGNLTISDVDLGDALSAQVVGSPALAWSGGPLTSEQQTALTAALATGALALGSSAIANGTSQTIAWTWDPAAANLDFLATGQTLTVTYQVAVYDGTVTSVAQPLTFTISGANDVPVIGGGTTGYVVKTGSLSTSGTLTIVDKDADQSGFVAQSNASGKYGTFTTDSEGHWSYNLDSNNASVKALAGTAKLTDTFTVTSLDGTASKTVSVTIYGSNTAPVATNVDITPVLSTTEFRVNTSNTGYQFQPSIATLADGGFVIAWENANSSKVGDIAAQRYDAVGNKIGSEFAVNSVTTGDQQYVKVAALTTGGFVVTWESTDGGSDNSGYGIKAQRYAADGSKLGTEFLVNTVTTGDQTRQGIAALQDGKFVIVWQSTSDATDTFGASTKGQIYNADGSKSGGEFLVNTTTAYDQMDPEVETLTNGNFVVTWYSYDGTVDTSGASIRAQIFSASGQKVGSELLINTTTAGDQIQPSVTGLANGGFVITWGSSDTVLDTNGGAIKAQIYSATGAKVGTEFLVNTYQNGTQERPVITALTNGGFVVSWISDTDSVDTSADSIKAQIFDSAGNKVGNEILVNTVITGSQFDPSVTALDSGGFVVTWYSAEAGNQIKAQIFDATGQRVQEVPSSETVSTFAVSKLLAGASDADGDALTVTATSATSTKGATVTLLDTDSNGTYDSVRYDTSTSTSIGALITGETIEDTFTFTVSDGRGGTSTAVASITVAGKNDNAVISGVSSGSVEEDGTLTASGKLTNADPDAGQASFVVQTATTGSYGTFAITAAGAWSYKLTNSLAAVQMLKTGETLTETFTVTSFDGTATQPVTIIINGKDDTSVITGTLTGLVAEDTLSTATGALLAKDGSTVLGFIAQTATQGTYGTFAITAAGTWTYTLDNSRTATQALASGQSVNETFTVISKEGTAASVVTVTVYGTAEPGEKIDTASLSSSVGLEYVGTAAGDKLSTSMSAVGDINGDGYDDFLIGSPYDDEGGSNAGAVYVVFGSSSGVQSGLGTITEGAGGFKITGLTASRTLGYAVSDAGDVNGDGRDDFIVADTNSSYVIYGSSNLSTVDLSSIKAGVGGFSIQNVNFAFAAAGDFNGDGHDDILIGDRFNDVSASDAGAAYILLGSSTPATNVDISAAVSNGTALRILGENATDYAGFSLSSVGDFNHDGYDDIVIGAYGNDTGGSNAGAAYVIYGSATAASTIYLSDVANGIGGFKIFGESQNNQAGYKVSSAGDVNHDGYDDVLIGANGTSTGAGAAYVVYGTHTALTTVNLDNVASGSGGFKIEGEGSFNYAGYSLADAGDINGDGIDDLVVSAYGNQEGGTTAGAAYVVFGNAAGLSTISLSDVAAGTGGFKVLGDTGDSLGKTLSAAGDVNGDGYDDILVGAPDSDAGGTDSGAAFVIYGSANYGGQTYVGTNDSDRFSVANSSLVSADGGSGFDTLALDGANLVLDFTKVAQDAVKSIEAIDITGSGDNLLQIAAADVLDMSSNVSGGVTTLTVNADTGDTVSLTGTGWTNAGTTSSGGVDYAVYNNASQHVSVLVDDHANVVLAA